MDAPNLDALRQELDAIDGDVHGLIKRRAALVGQISAAKPAAAPAAADTTKKPGAAGN